MVRPTAGIEAEKHSTDSVLRVPGTVLGKTRRQTRRTEPLPSWRQTDISRQPRNMSRLGQRCYLTLPLLVKRLASSFVRSFIHSASSHVGPPVLGGQGTGQWRARSLPWRVSRRLPPHPSRPHSVPWVPHTPPRQAPSMETSPSSVSPAPSMTRGEPFLLLHGLSYLRNGRGRARASSKYQGIN